MELSELEKSKSVVIKKIIEYVPQSIVMTTILKKITGAVSAVSFDSGVSLEEMISPFDTFIQIIEGKAEIIIDENLFILKSGDTIIIPAHSRSSIKAKERFKMISTVIKSGYESIS